MKPNTAIPIGIACDLSQMALEHAANKLGATNLCDLRVCCAWENRTYARKLQGEHGFELVLVPADLLTGQDAWTASNGGRVVYSPGA